MFVENEVNVFNVQLKTKEGIVERQLILKEPESLWEKAYVDLGQTSKIFNEGFSERECFICLN